ncbi:MAG: putative hydrocarbon binding protein, partial [Natronomonas sp.]
CDRVVSDMAVLTYESSRQLCEVGMGIIEGLANEYGEEVSIEEDRCMLEGDDRCEITVERV